LSNAVIQNALFAYKFEEPANVDLTYVPSGSGSDFCAANWPIALCMSVFACIFVGGGKTALVQGQEDYIGTDSPFSTAQYASTPDLQVFLWIILSTPPLLPQRLAF
jgi:hypothetical protein